MRRVEHMSEEPRTHTLIADDWETLIGIAPISVERFQIQRAFQGTGAKVVRLSFVEGQVMREHSTNAPLIVQLLDGRIDFRIAGETIEMTRGTILHVEPGELHELEARADSHVLLTLCA